MQFSNIQPLKKPIHDLPIYDFTIAELHIQSNNQPRPENDSQKAENLWEPLKSEQPLHEKWSEDFRS